MRRRLYASEQTDTLPSIAIAKGPHDYCVYLQHYTDAPLPTAVANAMHNQVYVSTCGRLKEEEESVRRLGFVI